jgi:hypothetical protein
MPAAGSVVPPQPTIPDTIPVRNNEQKVVFTRRMGNLLWVRNDKEIETRTSLVLCQTLK